MGPPEDPGLAGMVKPSRTGNFLDGSLKSKKGMNYIKRSGFCLETQFFPNSPNTENFPSTVLEPGKEFYSKTSFKFSVK